MKLKKKVLHLFFVLFILVLATFSSFAQMGGLPQFEWGARYIGSFLFSTPFDDAFATLYNPSFLSFMTSSQIGSEQKIVFGVPFTAITWAHAPTRLGGYLVIQESPEGLDFNYNTYRVALAWSYSFGGLSLGIAPKIYYQAITGINGDITSLGYGADVGLTFKRELEIGDFFFSLSGEDAYSLFTTSGGVKERASPPKYRAGIAFNQGGLKMGFTLIQRNNEQDFCLGVDYNLLSLWEGTSHTIKEVALRGGVREGWEDERSYSLGVGIMMRGFRIDYAYLFKSYGTETMLSTSLYF